MRENFHENLIIRHLPDIVSYLECFQLSCDWGRYYIPCTWALCVGFPTNAFIPISTLSKIFSMHFEILKLIIIKRLKRGFEMNARTKNLTNENWPIFHGLLTHFHIIKMCNLVYTVAWVHRRSLFGIIMTW